MQKRGAQQGVRATHHHLQCWPHELQDSPPRSQPDHIAARIEARIAAQGYPLVRLRHDQQADHSAGPRQADFGAALLNSDVDDNNTSVEPNRPATVPDNLHDVGVRITFMPIMMSGGGGDGGDGDEGRVCEWCVSSPVVFRAYHTLVRAGEARRGTVTAQGAPLGVRLKSAFELLE